jgi:hypothetical protein
MTTVIECQSLVVANKLAAPQWSSRSKRAAV